MQPIVVLKDKIRIFSRLFFFVCSLGVISKTTTQLNFPLKLYKILHLAGHLLSFVK